MKNSITTQLSRIFILVVTTLLLVNSSALRAQCGGSVKLDQHINAGPNVSSFDISTTYPNELIMISYDGFNFGQHGNGPITVDGNPATFINMADGGYSTGGAEVYAYAAPTAGSHIVVCDESGWWLPNPADHYYLKLCHLFLCNRCQHGFEPYEYNIFCEQRFRIFLRCNY
jgi:hypothetical protein